MRDSKETGVLIGISRMVKITHGHKDKLAKLLNNTITTLEDYQREYLLMVEQKNVEGLDTLIHTSTMTIYYIEAKKLDSLMRTTRKLMSEDVDERLLASSVEACTSEFRAVMVSLAEMDLDQALRLNS